MFGCLAVSVLRGAAPALLLLLVAAPAPVLLQDTAPALLLLLVAAPAPVLLQDSKAPLLLDYSDYYYDLYYGDYAYETPESHGTAPRSIRVENPPPSSVLKPARKPGNKKKKNPKPNQQINSRQGSPPPPPPPTVEPAAPTSEPLNVRLQRLVNRENAAARVILEILDAPRSNQDQIISFLEALVDEKNLEASLSSPTRPNQNFVQQQFERNNPTQDIEQIEQTRPTSPPTPPPTPPPTRPPPPPTRPPPPPTRPPPPPTRPPPPPTRPPPPPTRPPPPPTTRPPPPPPPPTRPPPPPPTRPPPPPTTPETTRRHPQPTESRQQPTSATRHLNNNFSGADPTQDGLQPSRIVNQQFSQFPNFQNHLNSEPENIVESPRNFGGGNQASDSRDGGGFNSFNKNDKDKNQFDRAPSKQEKVAPTPSSGLTIEEFLTRYPEVKRLSSRFNENGEDSADTTVQPKEETRNQPNRNTESPSFSQFSNNNEPVTEASFASAPITPRQRQTSPPPVIGLSSQSNHNSQFNQGSTFNQGSQAKSGNRRPGKKNSSPKNTKNNNVDVDNGDRNNAIDTNEEIINIDYNFDYDYYYDQLVPEHERFFQLPKVVTEDPEASSQKSEPFQVFTHFSVDNAAPQLPSRPNPPPPKPEPAHTTPTPRTPKAPKISSSKNSIAPAKPQITDSGAGPFGYPEKGTYFIDDHVNEFPEKIEVIYQGFVWALDAKYPDQQSPLHGGIHRILEDKVKREIVNLKDDHIIRVTGRASPYNINRLIFHTATGKEFGPWGDRHSDESIDFDVTAPTGHALSFFSGTVDFGVPLRSVGFHWKKI